MRRSQRLGACQGVPAMQPSLPQFPEAVLGRQLALDRSGGLVHVDRRDRLAVFEQDHREWETSKGSLLEVADSPMPKSGIHCRPPRQSIARLTTELRPCPQLVWCAQSV